jgi:hypothetical protein
VHRVIDHVYSLSMFRLKARLLQIKSET